MLSKFKLLISLGTAGVLGGTGAGVYLLQRKSEDKTFQKEEKFSGSLVFEQKNKDSDENKKIYQAKLDENMPEGIDEDKECKFESDVLTCKVSDLSKTEIDDYLKKLNSELESVVAGEDEKLSDKLKDKLKEKKSDLEEKFKTSIYEGIQTAFTSIN